MKVGKGKEEWMRNRRLPSSKVKGKEVERKRRWKDISEEEKEVSEREVEYRKEKINM